MKNTDNEMFARLPGRKRILITGGSGFWGRHIIEKMKGRHDIYFTYLSNKTEIPGCEALFMDLNNIETLGKIINDINPEIIIHTAAMTGPDECEKKKLAAYRVNTNAVSKMACASSWMGFKIIFFSTDLVFNGNKGEYDEYDNPDSAIVYGKTKILAERAIIRQASNYLIFRIALTYGMKHGMHGSYSDELYEKFKLPGKIRLFTDQFRSPLFVDDGVAVIDKSISLDVSNRVFHLAGPEKISRQAFGTLFAEIMGFDKSRILPVKISDLPGFINRGSDCSLNSTIAEKFFGYKFHTVREGLLKLRRNYKRYCG